MWCGTSRWQALGGVSRTTLHEQEVRASHVREQDGENEMARTSAITRSAAASPRCNSRFKNAQSANPRGPRPRNLPALPVEALNDKVVITMDGERRGITKCEAVPSNWSTNRPVRICARPRFRSMVERPCARTAVSRARGEPRVATRSSGWRWRITITVTGGSTRSSTARRWRSTAIGCSG